MVSRVSPNPVKVLEISGRVILGAIFVYASLGKILDPAAFAQAIANYQMIPIWWSNAAALILPWLELVSGICLVSGKLVRGSALVIALMLIAFMGALGYSAYRGLDIDCGCFSLNSAASSQIYIDILRDAALLAIALAVLVRTRSPGPLDRFYHKP